MAEVDCRVPGEAVEVAVPVDVGDPRSLPVGEGDVEGGVVGREDPHVWHDANGRGGAALPLPALLRATPPGESPRP